MHQSPTRHQEGMKHNIEIPAQGDVPVNQDPLYEPMKRAMPRMSPVFYRQLKDRLLAMYDDTPDTSNDPHDK